MTEKILKAVKKNSPLVWRKTLERKRLNKGVSGGKRSKISPENSENPIISNSNPTIQVDNLSEDDTIVRLKKENSKLKADLEKVENKLTIALLSQSQEIKKNSELLGKWKNEESINVEIRRRYHDLKDVLQKTKDELVIEQNKHQKELKLIAKESKEKDKISHNKLTAEKKAHKKVKEKLKNKRVECREIKEQLDDEKQLEIEELKRDIVEKENAIFHLTQENSDLQESLTNQQAEINDLATNLTNITNQRDFLQTEKDNLNVSYQTLQKNYTNLETTFNTLQVELQNKEKEIIRELNNSLNLNISEPTLSAIISHIKELITPLPAFSDDICIRDLEIIKNIDLIDMEKFLGIQLSAKEKQQFQSTAINYQELVNFRHSFLKQNLAQISTITNNKQSSKKENVLSVLLIMSLLIIGLQFIWIKKRSKRRVLGNI